MTALDYSNDIIYAFLQKNGDSAAPFHLVSVDIDSGNVLFDPIACNYSGKLIFFNWFSSFFSDFWSTYHNWKSNFYTIFIVKCPFGIEIYNDPYLSSQVVSWNW